LVPDAAAVVSGEVLLSDFRDTDGIARAAHGATPRWERFLLVLPRRPAGGEGAPVVIYGHGLTISKESMLVTAGDNARLGMATIGIDVPNHGERQIDEGGYLLELTTPQRFGRLASMPLQGIVDHVSLLVAVQDHLGALRVEVPAWLDRPASTSVQLDTSRLLYQGTSMGGVLGGAFVALAPELDGAFLQVAGSGIADTIFHSLLWVLFMGVIPEGSSTGDAYALMGGATMLLDHADNSNLLERVDPARTPVFLAYGAGDGIVPNFASDRMIALADLPLVGEQLVDVGVPFRRRGGSEVPVDGHGAAQIWPDSSPELQSFVAHVSFAQDRSVALLEQWSRGRLDALGVTS
jgi:pimeloyl-ACP methyl ester carboxylesterase